MIEVNLKINNETVFEYLTNSIPRIGEHINITHHLISGEFIVRRVTHRIFEQKDSDEILNYVVVEAEYSGENNKE